MSSGSTAMKLAKTKARTSRAPRAPSRVSVRVLVPWPPFVPVSSWVSPVTPVFQPAGAAAARARPMGPDGSGALEPGPGGRNTRAKLTEPPAAGKAGTAGGGLVGRGGARHPPGGRREQPARLGRGSRPGWRARRDRRGQHDRGILEAAGVVAALDG